MLAGAVLTLMVSIGMSLRLRDLVETWRSFSIAAWAWLLVATFLLPPVIALALSRALSLGLGATAGLFMVGATPGAPLLMRKIAKKGFDVRLGASYQVWGALLTPLMIPLLTFSGGKLYERELWIPPSALLIQICEKQFLPLLAGMALANFAPTATARIHPFLNALGNLVLTGLLLLLLVKMGPSLLKVDPWLFLAALGLAAICMLAVAIFPGADGRVQGTLAITNTNRHVGLALLLSQQCLHRPDALPAVACYALAAIIVIAAYTRLARRRPFSDAGPTPSRPPAVRKAA